MEELRYVIQDGWLPVEIELGSTELWVQFKGFVADLM
jgi:hypothetical protein